MYKIEISSNWYRNLASLNWIIYIYITVALLNQSTSGKSNCYTSASENNCLFINSSTVFKIGGLFDIGGSRPAWMGYSELIASKIAVKHFNNISTLYKVDLLVNDSKVGSSV